MKALRISLWTVFILLAGSLIGLTAEAQDVREKAEAEGKIVFYATFNTNDTRAMIEGFRKVYPKIEAAFYRATDAQLMERILTESRAGKSLWDVAMQTSFYGEAMKKKGLLAAYDSPERKGYREGYKDADGMWTSVYTNYAAFGFNTQQVPKSEVPKSYNDLLKPMWKDNLGMDGRAYEWFGTMLKAMGSEKGMKFMRALAKQQPQLRNGRTLISQLVAAGEFKGALTAYSTTFQQIKDAGAPADWVYLNPVFANIHPAGLSSTAPHPNAGKLFLDFMLSKKGQEIVRDMNRIPDHVDVKPKRPALMEGIEPVFAPAEVLENFEQYAKRFNEVFGGR